MADRPWAPNIFGTNDSDNNSFSFFPIWRSQINGTTDADDIFALAGNDIAYGYGGDDFIDGGSGNDTLYGGTGNDELEGGEGNDSLYGESGNDSLEGDRGNDVLYGGSGNDTLDGGPGEDTLYGGSGDDHYSVSVTYHMYRPVGSANRRTVTQVSESANQGIDTVHAHVTDYTLGDNLENLIFEGFGVYCETGNPDFGCVITALYSSPMTINGTGNALDNRIQGNIGRSSINFFLEGFAGNDTLIGESGQDSLYGGTGNDYLFGDAGNDVLLGEDGNDWLFGGTDNDLMLGGAGTDYLYGEANDDTFFGGQDSDNLFGGDGNDVLYGGDFTWFSTDSDASTDYLLGGNGDDALYGSGGDDFLYGESGADSLNGGAGIDWLTGNAGNDLLTGNTGADRFLYNAYRAFRSDDIGVDTINDFNWGEGDKIVLGKETFTALESLGGTGFSVWSEFASVSSDAAAEGSNAFIVYNYINGKLFYNANGSAGGFYNPDSSGLVGGGHFATLSNTPFLIGSDFIIQEPSI
ncbi:MAG: calcium-binding protein [Coleofasciculaceae cyanobacterium]